MGADLLRVVTLSGVSLCELSLRRYACSMAAFVQPSNVQASCYERARPMAVTVFARGRTTSSAAPPGRRGLERERQTKAEGKTKGDGTCSPVTPVCTWGWNGTVRLRRRAVCGVQRAPRLACPRALYARLRPDFARRQS